jgi:hypothetical protein
VRQPAVEARGEIRPPVARCHAVAEHHFAIAVEHIEPDGVTSHGAGFGPDAEDIGGIAGRLGPGPRYDEALHREPLGFAVSDHHLAFVLPATDYFNGDRGAFLARLRASVPQRRDSRGGEQDQREAGKGLPAPAARSCAAQRSAVSTARHCPARGGCGIVRGRWGRAAPALRRIRLFRRREAQPVIAPADMHRQAFARGAARVIEREILPQPRNLHARIALGKLIGALRPAESVDGNRDLRDASLPGDRLFAQE